MFFSIFEELKKQLFHKFGQRLRLNQKAAIFLVCFLLSVVFWVFTSLSKEYETQIRIPVKYRNIPFTKYFDSTLPTHVDFLFRSTGFRLTGVHLRDRPDSVIIDVATLPKNQSGLNFQTIALRDQWDGDLKPYKVIPESIKAGFNFRKSRKVPIRLISEITYRQRFEPIGNITLEPDSVDIAGPENILSKTNEIKTMPLIINDVFTIKQGELDLDKTSYSGLAGSVSKVHYHLSVEEYTEGMVEVPIRLPVSQRSNITLLPNTAKITYTAPLSFFSQIKKDDFSLVTELPASGQPAKLPVRLHTQPDKARILSIDPEFIDYLINK